MASEKCHNILHKGLFLGLSINLDESPEKIFTTFFKHDDSNAIELLLSSRKEINKSKEYSKALREEGNQLFEKKKLVQSLICYHKSICFAPRDSVEYGLAFGNRSILFFHILLYKECLKDIDSVLRSEYPKHLLHKVYLRQAKCFYKLKCFNKAQVALVKAEKSVQDFKIQIKHADIVKITKQIEQIKTNLAKESTTDEDIKVDKKSNLPKLRNGENPKLPSASKAITLRVAEDSSTHYVAASDIEKGDVLFVEKPYNWTPSEKLRKELSRCHYCIAQCDSFIPCVSCSNTFFCSDQCRQTYWDMFHKWECAGLRKEILTTEMSLALKVLVRNQFPLLKTQTGTLDEIFGFNASDNLWIKTSKWSVADVKRFAQDAVFLVRYLLTCTDYFDSLYSMINRVEGSLELLLQKTGTLIFKYLSEIEQRSSKIMTFHVNWDLQALKMFELTCGCVGLGIYKTALHLQHSCEPNAVVSFRGTNRIVRAIKTIKKGTNITVSNKELHLFEMENETHQMLLKKEYSLCPCGSQRLNVLFNAWLCPACSGKALPMLNANEAECTKCHHSFSLNKYKEKAKKVAESLISIAYIEPHTLLDVNSVLRTYNIMKNIYYKYHIEFSIIYRSLIYYYRNTGELLLSLKYGELLVDLCKTLLGDTSPIYAVAMLKYTFSLIYNYRCYVFQRYGRLSIGLELPISIKQTGEDTRNALKYHGFEDDDESINRFLGFVYSEKE